MIRDRYHRFPMFYDLEDVVFFGIKQELREKVIEFSDTGEDKLVLDLMVGTAESSLLAARTGARVVSLDFSKPMLRIAHRKIADQGLDTISLVMGRAETLPFADNTFDAVFCTFGLDTVLDPEPVVSEMMRVAKETSSIAAAHKYIPKNRIISLFDTLFEAYLNVVWQCRSVDLSEVFRKVGLRNIFEENYYYGINNVIVGRKPAVSTFES